jgi:hypothetical protein
MTFHDPHRHDEASRIRAQLEAREIERLRLEARLREIESEQEPSPPSSLAATVTNGSPAADKVALFRKLFAGRTDVFPARWVNPKSGRSGYAPACANEWVRGVCGKPQVRCGECRNQSFIPVTDEVIEAHLRGEDRVRHNGRGDFIAGVYPLLFDDTCRFLAVDFDDESWSSDALAFLASCRELGIPAALERSRSGSGGHVWLFFRRRPGLRRTPPRHREHHAKREVIVYDYVDSDVPLLARMALKHRTGYRSLGFEISKEVAAAMTAERTVI